MAQYLVTGGAGFIGSHLVERLAGRGDRVRVLDDFSTGRPGNLEPAQGAGGDRVEVVTGDIRDAETVRRVMSGVDGVFHLAALGSVPRSVAQPEITNAVNVDGTLVVLLAARDAGVGRLVYAGSSSVYGALEALPKRENHPTVPKSPYGLSKLTAEHYVRLFRELYGLSTVTLRYYNVFGPRQNPQGEYAAVIPRFIAQAMRGETVEVFGDGEQSRDFTYVANTVDGTVLAMEAAPEKASPGLFNLAAGTRVSLNELIGDLGRILDRPVTARHSPARPGDVRHSQADIGRARASLGYEPRISFIEGLERTVRYFQDGGETV